MDKKLVIYALSALIVTALIFGLASNQAKPQEIHHHFDFLLYLDGQAVDLGQDQYQATAEHPLDERVHLHDGNGKVVHIHAAEVTLDDFLDSLGIELHEVEGLRIYVNGREEKLGLDYQPKDLDQILVTDSASEATIQEQLASLTNNACIYSEKCPERGKPPTESCVGQCVI
ncbi:MAG TPA: hypothetical protein HA252_00355 [Candidatus Diapherotrites archaeon]|uniref:Uncharacterized protein n=1 Tax=Candidatus Iainarchaeum sp. TaxID=3101447 RepID=A0A7J4JFE3_9ARCH|nr:hypothetical protein [Candidatus Diapherotrites archaeon]HIH15840.1 hypothetical protein [Candidatus Diapherotrites archaeon]